MLVESYDHLATTLVRSDFQATSPSRAICLQKIVQQNGFDGFVFDGEVLRWKKMRVVSSEWECECECESEKKTNKMKSKSVRGVFKIEIFFLYCVWPQHEFFARAAAARGGARAGPESRQFF